MQGIPKISKYCEIPLDDLVIGQAQVRLHSVGNSIDELADSIRQIGLLHPIVVCSSSEKAGKYEILIGQRRFLAHKELQKETIFCAVFDEPVDQITAKVISLSENMVRKGLDLVDLTDVCTYLYNHYGNMKIVAEETGLRYDAVREYVKFDRLNDQLKELVKNKEVDLKTALRAQNASEAAGSKDPEEAVKLVIEMKDMSSANQRQLVDYRVLHPKRDIDEVIEHAKSGDKLMQISVTISDTINNALQRYAKDEGTNRADAAVSLIEEGLQNKGLLEILDD